eukprot:6554563-Alexandrium_andersonii.AAC.1
MAPSPADEALQRGHVEAIPGSTQFKLQTPEAVLRGALPLRPPLEISPLVRCSQQVPRVFGTARGAWARQPSASVGQSRMATSQGIVRRSLSCTGSLE